MNKLRKNRSAALRALRLRLESLEERQLLTAVGLLETSCVAEAAPLVCAASADVDSSQAIDLTKVAANSDSELVVVSNAETWIVDTTADSGEGSLRAAIASAKAGDTIKFDDDLQGQTILLDSTLKIQKALTIDASDLVNMDGTPGLKIDAQQNGSVISVTSLKDGESVVLKGLELTNGKGQSGGGLYVGSNCKVEAIDSTISGNNADSGAGVFVGGDFLSVNTTISQNVATGRGGGVNVAAGAVFTSISTKIDGNEAVGNGGGVYVAARGEAYGRFKSYSTAITDNESSNSGGGVCVAGEFKAFSATIAGNTAVTSGGGILIRAINSPNWFYNSIVYGNAVNGVLSDISASSGGDVRAWNTLSSYSEWVQDEGCIVFDGEVSDLFADPENSDYTLRSDEEKISPAIDAGANVYVSGDDAVWKMVEADLAGNYRMRQGKADSAQTVDMGAYEYVNSDFPVTIAVSNVNDVEDLADGAISLREAVKYAVDNDMIALTEGETYVLAGKQIEVDKSVKINGAATIDGDEQSRIFYVAENCTLQLNNLTLQNGKAGTEDMPENGGAIYNDGTLALAYVNMKDNVATKNGGAVFNNKGGKTFVQGGDISNNSATNAGGAFANYGSNGNGIQISGATISENTAERFGGAYFGCGFLQVGKDTTFSKNEVTAKGSKGGAIYNDKNGDLVGAVLINGTDVKFSENSAVERGGAIMSYSQLVVAGPTTATFEKNTAERYGGAIDAGKGCNAFLGGVLTFTENKATSETYGVGFGGAIFSAESLSFTGGEYTFTGNTATKSGGAIDAAGGSLLLLGKFTFDSNGADSCMGGAIVSAATIRNLGKYTWSGNYAKYGNCVAVATNISGNENLTAADFGLEDGTNDFKAFKFTSSQSLAEDPIEEIVDVDPNSVFAESGDWFDEFAGLDSLI